MKSYFSPAELARMALERLAKWRTVFAGWQLGMRSLDDAESNAVRDHREATMILRAEVTALTGLLLKKGVFSQDEYQVALYEEANELSRSYEELFPGFKATDDGLTIDTHVAAETMRKRNFRP